MAIPQQGKYPCGKFGGFKYVQRVGNGGNQFAHMGFKTCLADFGIHVRMGFIDNREHLLDILDGFRAAEYFVLGVQRNGEHECKNCEG